LLDNETLPAGGYSWIRLMVNAEADGVYDSYIVINGAQYELRVPSGSQSGLKLNRPFDVPSNTDVELTIDFDLRKSVHNPQGATYQGVPVYFLRPTLRIVATTDAGYISGSLDAAVFTGLICSAPEVGYVVYVFSGNGGTPDDLDGDAGDPVTTANLSLDGAGNYTYTTALLAPGDYTLAATCEADNDDPEVDDAIIFVGTDGVTVATGEGAILNFTP